MKTIKNCIFDFDGTLVDSFKDVRESLAHAFASCDINVKKLKPEIIMQLQLFDAIQSVAPEITKEQRERVISVFKEQYDKSDYPNTHLMPGVLELLNGLKKKAIPCFIVSNKRRKPTLRILNNLKLNLFFTEIFNPDMYSDSVINKTKSQLISAAIAKYNLSKDETAYVGDMEADVIAAKENGLIAAVIHNGYGNADICKIRPDYMMHRISEILEIVQ